MTSRRHYEKIDAFDGAGSLRKENEPPLDVGYDIEVFQEFFETTGLSGNASTAPGLKRIEGRISSDPATLTRLVMSGDIYVLHFEGNKRLKLFVKNNNGTISANGPIYEEES